MKDLTPKFDDTAGATGQLTAPEFNDFANDVQTAITESGQALTGAVGDDNRQLAKAIAVTRQARTDTQTALIGEIVLPDNASAALTINLPSTGLFIGATVYFEQVTDQLYSSFSLTIGRNGNSIEGAAEDFILDSSNSNNTKIAAVWISGSVGWKILVVGAVGAT